MSSPGRVAVQCKRRHLRKVNGEILAIVYRYYQQKEPIFDMGSIGKLWENEKDSELQYLPVFNCCFQRLKFYWECQSPTNITDSPVTSADLHLSFIALAQFTYLCNHSLCHRLNLNICFVWSAMSSSNRSKLHKIVKISHSANEVNHVLLILIEGLWA